MKYFQPAEYRCPCGRSDCEAPKELSPTMQSILDRLRERLGRPVTLNSALRCPAHTKAVGGVEGSEHGEGDGVDIRVSGSRERFNIVTAALSLGVTRIGIGKTFVHLGTSIKHDLAVIWLYS